MDHSMLTAHSGCDGTPDNSIAFIEVALAAGVDAFEVDINVRRRDGTLYLRHDEDPKGEYADCVPLAAAFERMALHGEININCDLKSHGLEDEVLRLADSCGVAGRLIFSGSVGLEYLRRNPRIHDRVAVFLNIEEIFTTTMTLLRDRLTGSPADFPLVARRAAEACKNLGVPCINVHHKLCTDEFISIMEENGIGISAWTVDASEDIRRLLKKNIANITTRRAALAVSLRRELAGGERGA